MSDTQFQSGTVGQKEPLSSFINLNDTILMQGGGNFGDLWRFHSETRNKVVEKFQKNQIIFMPQTINYKSNSKYLKTDQQKLSLNSKLIISTRSSESHMFSVKNFPLAKSILVPDLAFMLTNTDHLFTNYTSIILYDVLILRRTDQESKYSANIWQKAYSQYFNFEYSYLDIDWFNYMESPSFNGNYFKNKKNFQINDLNEYMNKISSQRAILVKKIMSQAKIVVTDRLHASIYSILIGKTHIIVDDKYKKIFNTRETAFSNKSECNAKYLQAFYALNPADAIKAAVDILKSGEYL